MKLTEESFDYCRHGLLLKVECVDGKDLELQKQILENQEKLEKIEKMIPEYEKGLDKKPVELPFSLYIKLKEILGDKK